MSDYAPVKKVKNIAEFDPRAIPRVLQAGYGFRDVVLKPRRTSFFPEDVDLTSRLTRSLALHFPVLSSPMSSVTSERLAIAMAQAGSLGVLHRDCSTEAQLRMLERVKDSRVVVNTEMKPMLDQEGRYFCGASIGAFELERALSLCKKGVDLLFLDCAQPHHAKIVQFFENLREQVSVPIIVGNVVTAEAAREFIELGAAGLKVGLGGGSACTTTEITGVGIPQIAAILEVASVSKKCGIPIIADGGIRSAGDIVKALAAGADSVMVGGVLAGTEESAARVVRRGKARFKKYNASKYISVELPAVTGWKTVDEFRRKGMGRSFRVEGIGRLIPHAGPAHFVLIQLLRSIRLGLAFVGCGNIEALHRSAEFVPVSHLPGANATNEGHIVVNKNTGL